MNFILEIILVLLAIIVLFFIVLIAIALIVNWMQERDNKHRYDSGEAIGWATRSKR